MKLPVSFIASLVVASATITGCGAKAGKAEFSEVCLEKMGGSQAKCSCYVDSVVAELPPDAFSKFAQGVVDNRRFVGLVPESLIEDRSIATAVTNATHSCFA